MTRDERFETCPFCQHHARYSADPAAIFCDEHYRQYLLTFQVSPTDLDAYRSRALREPVPGPSDE